MTRSSIRCSSGMDGPPILRQRSPHTNSSNLPIKPNHMTNSYKLTETPTRLFRVLCCLLLLTGLWSINAGAQTTMANYSYCIWHKHLHCVTVSNRIGNCHRTTTGAALHLDDVNYQNHTCWHVGVHVTAALHKTDNERQHQWLHWFQHCNLDHQVHILFNQQRKPNRWNNHRSYLRLMQLT
jgi:hypothetical protein